MTGLNSRASRLLLACAFACALAAPAAAADDIFLKLDGVRGESTVPEHRNEIELLSYTHSIAGPFARGTPSGGAGAGKTTCGPVTLMKYVDLSSPDLILYVANGRHIPTAVITFRKPGAKGFEYYKVILEDVIVTEIEQSDTKLNFPNPAPPRAIEKVSLIGRRIRFEYTEQTDKGGAGGKPKAGWDCAANSKV